MKQFFGCLFGSIIFFLICALIAADFNVSNWNPEGRCWAGLFISFIWIIPIYLNYIELRPNFCDNPNKFDY